MKYLSQLFRKYKNEVICNNKKLIYLFLCLSIFCLSLIFLLWRAKFGFCFNDEPFNFTLAQRLYNGDCLLVDEWHGQQNFGVILLPFYYLYQNFFMSNEGILLFSRYIYCFLWFGVCLIVFKTLKKYSFAALIGFIYLILFSPLDYMTLSYTSISLMCTLLICCMLYYYFELDSPCLTLSNTIIFSGVLAFLIIVDVICCPYLAIAYILITILILFLYFSKRFIYIKTKIKNIASIWTFVTIFVAVIGILYLYIFIFSKSSIMTVFENLKFILTSPDLKKMSFIGTIYEMLSLIYFRSRFFSIIIFMSFIICIFHKNIERIRLYIISICSISWIVTQFTIINNINNHEFNFQMLYIALLGFIAFLLLKEKPWKLFYTFYVIGIIFTYFTSMKTNTGLYSISMTLSICGIVGIIFIVLLSKELLIQFSKIKILKSIIIIGTVLILSLQLFSELYVRFSRTYYDENLEELKSQISVGAAKGLVTTSYMKGKYESEVSDLKYLLSNINTENKKILIYTSAPYLYLDANLNMSTFSSWTFGYNNLKQRFDDYYKIHKNSIPDLIFITNLELKNRIDFPSDYECVYYGKSLLLIKK